MRVLIGTLFLLVLFSCQTTRAVDDPSPTDGTPVFYFFHSERCPHCVEAKPFIAELKKRYPQIEIREMEVSGNLVNREIFRRKIETLGVERRSVPFFLIGTKYVVGFKKGLTEGAITTLIDEYLAANKKK